MKPTKSDLPQGALDLLILKVVLLGPIHGYAIAQRLDQVSRGVVQVPQGSLYPALHRLENRGLLAADWKATETRREAKFYRLTRKGRAQLETESQSPAVRACRRRHAVVRPDCPVLRDLWIEFFEHGARSRRGRDACAAGDFLAYNERVAGLLRRAAVVSVATTPSTSAAMWAALKRRVEVAAADQSSGIVADGQPYLCLSPLGDVAGSATHHFF